ncbi:MAG: DUF4232 domain-containing protein [Acidimicrobiales bacterium]
MNRALKSLAIFIGFVVIFTLSRHYLTTTATTTTTTLHVAGSTTTSSFVSATTCQGREFKGAYNEGEGAAGTIVASVTLTKQTPGSCSVDGYPTLTLQDESGAVFSSTTSTTSPVQFPAAAANKPPSSVTVTSGGTIHFSLGYSDVPVGTEVCTSAVTISVQFQKGGSTTPVTPSYPIQPCNAGTIWVSPFY